MKHTTDIYHLFSPRSESHGIALARAGFADGADGTCFELTRTPLDCRTVFPRVTLGVVLALWAAGARARACRN